MSRDSTEDGKGLEFYKGHSPLASGVRQTLHVTYSQCAAITKHTRCLSSTTHTHIEPIVGCQAPHTHIANTYDQVPVKHHKHMQPTYIPCAASTNSTRCHSSTTIHTYSQEIRPSAARTQSTRCLSSTTISHCRT